MTPEQVLEQNAKNLARYYRYKADSPERLKLNWRRKQLKKYGLTIEQYDAMLDAQQGVCRICRRQDPSGKPLSVDHCHTKGKVRGLLCSPCNVGIAMFADSPQTLRAAADYIELNSHG